MQAHPETCRINNEVIAQITGRVSANDTITKFVRRTKWLCLTLQRFQVWVSQCPPAHTSSNQWTGGTGPACRGPAGHSQGWRWLPVGSAEPHLERSASPGHKRELSLKPRETHSIHRNNSYQAVYFKYSLPLFHYSLNLSPPAFLILCTKLSWIPEYFVWISEHAISQKKEQSLWF